MKKFLDKKTFEARKEKRILCSNLNGFGKKRRLYELK